MTYFLQVFPFYELLKKAKYSETASQLKFQNAPVWLPATSAKHIETLIEKIQTNCEADKNIFIAPVKVGFFPLINKKSVIYDTFPVYPATETAQLEIIKEIEENDVQFAFVENLNLDGKVELRFEHTYPLVWGHLKNNFHQLASQPFNNNYNFFQKRKTNDKKITIS